MPRKRNAMWRACMELQSLVDEMQVQRAQLIARRAGERLLQQADQLVKELPAKATRSSRRRPSSGA